MTKGHTTVFTLTSAATSVPEPSSFALLGLALPAMGLMARNRRTRNR